MNGSYGWVVLGMHEIDGWSGECIMASDRSLPTCKKTGHQKIVSTKNQFFPDFGDQLKLL